MQGKHFFGGLKLFYYFSIMGIRVVTNIQAPFPAGSLTARLPLIFHVSVILRGEFAFVQVSQLFRGNP